MKVLVTAASKYGATEEMAYAIAKTLRAAGISTTLVPMAYAGSLKGYDAVVVGSAVYAGRWLNEAQQFLETHRDELRGRMVWLFSDGEPSAMSRLFSRTDPMEHKVLSCAVQSGWLNTGGRARVTDPHVPSEDYVDFDEVRRWALHIAGAICAASSSTAGTR